MSTSPRAASVRRLRAGLWIAFCTCLPLPAAAEVFINELHYDDATASSAMHPYSSLPWSENEHRLLALQ